jgi:membrane associated rhomboid family serine protease
MTRGLIVLMALVAVAWAVEIVDAITNVGMSALGMRVRSVSWLDSFGITPRSLSGLLGIFFAPFLHGSFAHLIANTVPFLTLGFLVMLRGLGTFIGVTLTIMVLGGLAVWLFGAGNSVHVGASGVIFGYIGYLLARGYFERSFGSIAIAVLVAVVYGGALWGVLPGNPRISWQGHLFGFLAGVVAAGLLRSQPTARASVYG